MDLASIIGIAAGFILLIFGIVFGDTIDFGMINNFIDGASIIITIGGSLASTLTSNSIKDFMNGFKSIRSEEHRSELQSR